MNTTNQLYNKTITLKQPELIDEGNDLINNLSFFVYNGKLTVIADIFNKLSVEDCEKIIQKEMELSREDQKTSLLTATYLGFANIFLYLLTFKANAYYIDKKGQSAWHYISYKGHVKLLSTLLNYERFKLKMEALDNIDNIKKSYGFSKLDIVKGKLSRAVNLTETNVKKFHSFQIKLKEEAWNLVKRCLQRFEVGLEQRDKEGRTALHYAAMSKYPLSYLIVINILDFDFFKLDEWDEFLNLYEDVVSLEVKLDRLIDPRRSLRLERELLNLLGDDIIKELAREFKKMKFELFKRIINTQDTIGDSVLHVAAFHGDYRIVNKLLSFGADKTLKNDDGKMPVDLAKDNYVRKVLTNLNKAAKASDVKNVTELVHFGHDINSKMSIFSQAPIHKVVESHKEDKYDVMKKMLDMGADPNIKDSNGWTALHYSCQFGDIEMVRILVTTRANIDSYSNNHRTPLHLASYMNFPAIVKYLLENSSNPNFKDHSGCTPLHLASKNGNVDCLAILLAYGGNLYEEDFRKWNILHYAAFQGHHQCVRFIAKYDSDYDILQTVRNSQNKLAIEIVRDPSVKPFFISLWHASKTGDLDMIRQLVNDGENVNEESTFLKNTPLHLAVLNNHYLLVRLLIENKSNIDIRNKDGIVPSEYADIMNAAINKYIMKSDDPNAEYVDLRDFVRNIINKNEKILNSTICSNNRKVRLWNVQDFNNKICKLLSGGHNNNHNNLDNLEKSKIHEESKKSI
jgi:ankyrin repeat protein